MSMKIMPHHLQQPLPRPLKTTQSSKPQQAEFQNVLKERLNDSIKISRHAEKRMEERGIHLPEQTWQEMTTKIKEAHKRGVNDSLVLTNSAAFVVSAKNETVITAMNREEASEQLFTNINGAIILKD
ncbi:TIGR02530 family flagellar biosynthesis protein [Alkalicoccus daliensis]|uniref:Flagellar operon protein n=1 Tax=Alkalicoccus daliensis TaxID=745820 RepID=A0A1H0A639_9BACI|nr:TIGR02530 family flagellar biosynthesis protein [Alkalicoccus daliensis]SDN28196.1 flagellar operon protein [Alkalicoccus daliensis]